MFNFSALSATKQIPVGPNILVSREFAFPNVELMVAANPKNPTNPGGTVGCFVR